MDTWKLLLAAMLAVAVLAFGLRNRMEAAKHPSPAANAVAILDNSTSQSLDCEQFAGMVADQIDHMPNRATGSQLTILTLGKPASSFEPISEKTLSIAPQQGTNFNTAVDVYGAVKMACQNVKPVTSSSIYRAVQVGLELIKTQGSGVGLILVSSDAQENVERRYFSTSKAAPPSLSNHGVRFLLCGYASTLEAGGPRGPLTDQLLDRWRERFTDPSSVTFMPYCPVPSRGAEASNGKGDGYE